MLRNQAARRFGLADLNQAEYKLAPAAIKDRVSS